MSSPRIDLVSASYFRKGKCAGCGASGVERSRTFTGTTLEACQAQAERWFDTPLHHRRCEWAAA